MIQKKSEHVLVFSVCRVKAFRPRTGYTGRKSRRARPITTIFSCLTKPCPTKQRPEVLQIQHNRWPPEMYRPVDYLYFHRKYRQSTGLHISGGLLFSTHIDHDVVFVYKCISVILLYNYTHLKNTCKATYFREV